MERKVPVGVVILVYFNFKRQHTDQKACKTCKAVVTDMNSFFNILEVAINLISIISMKYLL